MLIQHGVNSEICFLCSDVSEFQFSEEFKDIRISANKKIVNYCVTDDFSETRPFKKVFVLDKQIYNTLSNDSQYILCDNISVINGDNDSIEGCIELKLDGLLNIVSQLMRETDVALVTITNEFYSWDDKFKIECLWFATHKQEFKIIVDRDFYDNELTAIENLLSTGKAWIHDIKKEMSIYWRLTKKKLPLQDVSVLLSIDNPSNTKEKISTLLMLYLSIGNCQQITPISILKLKKLLYEKHSEPYQYFIKQSYLSCILESNAIGWDEGIASKIEKVYCKKRNEYLLQIINLLKINIEIKKTDVYDEHSQLKRILNLNTKDGAALFYSVFRCEDIDNIAKIYWIERQLIYEGVYSKYCFILKKPLQDIIAFLSEENTHITKKVLASVSKYQSFYDSISQDNLYFFYMAYKKYADNFDIDMIETWDDRFKLLFFVKAYKKIDHVITTFISGNLGRNNVYSTTNSTNEFPQIRYEKYNGNEKNIYLLNTRFSANSTETRRWDSGFHIVPSNTEIRRIYTPRNNFLVCHFDYSQIELRVLAALSKDNDLLTAFKNGLDIHKFIAAYIFNKNIDEVDNEERSLAKIASFSLLYGKKAENFARDFLNGDIEKAESLFNSFYSSFKNVHKYILEMQNNAVTNATISSAFGDVIYLKGDVEKLKRLYVNSRIQNTASQLAALNLYYCDIELKANNIPHKTISFTHDAGEIEFDANYFNEFLNVLYNSIIYNDTHPINPTLDIELKIGVNLYDLVKFKKIKDNKFKIQSTEYALNLLLDKLSVSKLEITNKYTKKVPYDNMFLPKNVYSLSIGREISYVEGEIEI